MAIETGVRSRFRSNQIEQNQAKPNQLSLPSAYITTHTHNVKDIQYTFNSTCKSKSFFLVSTIGQQEGAYTVYRLETWYTNSPNHVTTPSKIKARGRAMCPDSRRSDLSCLAHVPCQSARHGFDSCHSHVLGYGYQVIGTWCDHLLPHGWLDGWLAGG